MENTRGSRLALRAEDMLQSLNDINYQVKLEVGDSEYYKRYTKADISKMPMMTKALVEKTVEEMENDGYSFQRTLRGTTNPISFTMQNIIDMYSFRGAPAYRERFSKAYVIFVGNLKGGVSKTVSTVSLAHGLRTHPMLLKEDLRILVVDLDPQSSATMFLNNGKAIGDVDYTAVQAMLQGVTREDLLEKYVVKSVIDGVDVIPSSIDDSFIAARWDSLAGEHRSSQHKSKLLLENIVEKLSGDYQFIIIDSGPHIDALLENALVAADLCITPIPPTTVDFHSTLKYLKRLPEIIDDIQRSGADVHFEINIGFMSKIANKEKHQEIHSKAKEVFGADMLDANLAKLDGFERTGETFDTVISANPATYDGSPEALKSATKSAYAFSRAVFDRINIIRNGGF
jgi:cellulose biosynthesis protein BcsQ